MLALVVAVVGSLLPSDSGPIEMLDSLSLSDKAEHYAVYALLMFLPALHERKGFVITAAIGALALGIALEFAQLYTGWRDFEVGDMIADLIGICFGLAVGIAMRPAANRFLSRLAPEHEHVTAK